MWNSPKVENGLGKRYQVEDLAVLITPMTILFDSRYLTPLKDMASEAILGSLDDEEFIFAWYQVFQALLEDIPVPAEGHTGIQEAIVADLLTNCCEQAIDETSFADGLDLFRQSAWQSIERLLISNNGQEMPSVLEKIGFNPAQEHPHLSPLLTRDVWHQLILGDGGLFDEFFWDTDWRLGGIMDLPPDEAHKLAKLTGIDLDVTHGLAHTPSPEEFATAEKYIIGLIHSREPDSQPSGISDADDESIPF